MTNELFTIIGDERKKREIDPTLAVLRECVSEIDDKESRKRIKDMLTFFEEMPPSTKTSANSPGGVLRQGLKVRAQWNGLFGNQKT